ncbi:MAG: energy-coupling factor transporter transmembrane protein EcfT [Aigarchaeota archaeon]|nr:energy-coupling factor transporter transmembrane protein EcfT [Candidatus Wolframiiraptor gerlachensis]
MVDLDLDPRTKIIAFSSVIALAFISKDLLVIAALAAAIMAALLLSDRRGFIMRGLKGMTPLLIIAFLLWSFMHEWSLFQRHESGINLQLGVFMSLRLFLILLTSLGFIATIGMRDLVNALNSFRLPYKAVFVLGLTMRHLHTIAEDYKAIKEAQSSRGLELDKGSLFRRIKNYVPVLIPLFVRSIENAERLTLAMELRAFSLNRKRSLGRELKILDLVVIVGFISALTLAILHYLFAVI